MSNENQVATRNNAEVSIQTPDNVMQSLEGVQGITMGEMGVKVSRTPIAKYKGSTQKNDRISFITKNVMAIKTHYFDGVGSILCFGKKCCEMGGFPSVRYLFPVVIYNTDNEGEIVSNKLDIKILSASEDFYKSILTINRAAKAMGGIDKIDLLVTCTDDKYQKLTLNQAGPATWRKSDKAIEWVQDKWTNDAEFAYMAVARSVDESAFLNLMGLDDMGGNDAPQQVQSNQDINNYFND